MTNVGIIHPGAMGSSLGAALAGNGHDVLWVAEGRGSATQERAKAEGLVDVGTLEVLAARCDVIVSVCPPDAALEVGRQVADVGFSGTYLDANAVSPATTRSIGNVVEGADAVFVDGGIVGPPARQRGTTVLYLSGESGQVAKCSDLFAGSVVETHLLEGGAGAASATKMAFAAWTKGTSALLLSIRALAERENVVDGLEHAWSVLTPDLAARLTGTAATAGPKAWRFEGEMREIAATFESVGLPGGFHQAAAEIYRRLSTLRDKADASVDDVVSLLSSDELNTEL